MNIKNLYGIEVPFKNIPEADNGFVPFYAFIKAFNQSVGKSGGVKLKLAVERENGYLSVFDTVIHGTNDMYNADLLYIERIVKFMLWSCGGWNAVGKKLCRYFLLCAAAYQH